MKLSFGVRDKVGKRDSHDRARLVVVLYMAV